jgi:hypothetical protein
LAPESLRPRRDGPAACLQPTSILSIHSDEPKLNRRPSAEPKGSTPSIAAWEYADPAATKTDGVMTALAADLLPVVPYDHLRLDESKRGAIHRIAIQLRQAGKRVFHVKLVRRGGKMLVRLGGMDPTRVLEGVRVCRSHFDRWFGITPTEIEALEHRPKSRPSSADSA